MNQIRRGGFLKRKPIKKRGERSISWETFRDLKALKDRDEEGLIKCQDYLIGLPRCGVAIPSPDLHHTKGRDGNLLFDERWMVWLVRSCHDEAHLHPSRTSPKAQDDQERQVEATPQRDALLGVQGRSSQGSYRKPRTTVFSSVQNRYAEKLARKGESRI